MKAIRESPQLDEMEFDISRTFVLLLSVLVLPVFMSLSVVSLSTAAIL